MRPAMRQSTIADRRNVPFVAIDCSVLHRFDPFQTGTFEQARGGTVFLLGVGDNEPKLQRTLDRVLREQSEGPTDRSIGNEANVRVIAATHRDLQAMTAEGQFSEQLYARLSAVRILLPPLRKRREDIPLLISEINARLAGCGYLPDRMTDRALRALLAYDWPGNVRELARLIECCMIRAARREIQLEDLPGRIRGVNEIDNGEIPAPDVGNPRESNSEQFGTGKIEFKGLLELLEFGLGRVPESLLPD
jgi:DNA-binding NtrC family response regulator